MSEQEQQALASRLAEIEPDLTSLARQEGRVAAADVIALLEHADERVRANTYTLLSMTNPAAFSAQLARAAADPSRIVRMQAAISMRNIPLPAIAAAQTAAITLLQDPDPGVRKFALKGAGPLDAPEIVATVDRMRADDPETHLRELAADIHANR